MLWAATFVRILLFLLFFAASSMAWAQNLVPLNFGAETGDFAGWTVGSTSFGSAPFNDPANQAAINTVAAFTTEGAYSFYLHDDSATSSMRMMSAVDPNNRIRLESDTTYQLTFDALVVGAPDYAILQLRLYTESTSESASGQFEYDLRAPGDFAMTATTVNGFTTYTLNFHFESAGPIATPVWMDFDIWTDFYRTSVVDLYVDNIQMTAVPEPAVGGIFISGLLALTFCRRRGR